MSVEMDEDDDFYSPEEPTVTAPAPATASTATPTPAAKPSDELEEGEEEDEGGAMDEDEDDSDIDIITDRKDGTKAAPPSQSKYSEIRNIPQRSTGSDTTTKPVAGKKEDAVKGSDLPPPTKSSFDAYAIPIHKATGKPLTQVSIDEDLGEDAAPWRKPGTDTSDYFNYGFDEFSWTMYAQKQTQLRAEYSQEAMSQNSKKMMEDLNMMMMGGMPGAMPGMGAGPGAGAGGMGGAMPGMDGAGIPPEMQAMMQQMMASGMDPSQMDPASMFAAMQGGAGGGGGGQGGNQNFGGFSQNQGYGYDQGMGGRGGGFRGGRGGRRGW